MGVQELVQLRADEDAAHKENNRRSIRHGDALRDRYEIQRQLEGAVEYVAEFFEGTFTAQPSDLYPVKRPRWKAAWKLEALGWPLEVRMNTFYGMRIMDGSGGDDYDGRNLGRRLESIGDLAGVGPCQRVEEVYPEHVRPTKKSAPDSQPEPEPQRGFFSRLFSR